MQLYVYMAASVTAQAYMAYRQSNPEISHQIQLPSIPTVSSGVSAFNPMRVRRYLSMLVIHPEFNGFHFLGSVRWGDP
jgi:hypothetical protein